VTAQEGAIRNNLAIGKAPLAACIFLGVKASLLSDAEALDQAWATTEPTDSTANAYSTQSTGKCVTLGFWALSGYS